MTAAAPASSSACRHMRRVYLLGFIGLVAVPFITGVTTACVCSVDCSETVMEISVTDPEVRAVEACSGDLCMVKEVGGFTSAAAPAQVDFNVSDLDVADTTYTLTALDSDMQVLAETELDADLRRVGRCTCHGGLTASVTESGVTLNEL